MRGVALDLKDGVLRVLGLLERAQLLCHVGVQVDEPLDEQVQHARAQRMAVLEQLQSRTQEAHVDVQIKPPVRQVLLDR